MAIERVLLLTVLPAIVLCALIEALVLSRHRHYDWRAAGVSLFDVVARISIQILLPLTIAAPLLAWAWQHRIGDIALDTAWAIAALFVGQELCYYVYHRASHRVRWFWCNHAVHHSSNQLNLGAALRIGWLGRLTGTPLFFAPLVWLGFPPKIVFAMLSLNLLYQFWIHATWIPKLGWLEYLLNTPSSHRVHHAANVEYLDANYGGVLIVFDRMFGTYRAERDDLPCRYGLVKPITSYNPLRIQFDQWLLLMRDLLRSRSPREVIGNLLMPPGWKADGSGDTTENLRRHPRPWPNLSPD